MSITTGRINLDYLAAKYAHKVVGNKDMENSVSKALGVLQEHGVYGAFLYLLAKEGSKNEDNGRILCNNMIELLHEAGFPYKTEQKPATTKDILNHVIDSVSSASLQRLLFAKELIEQMFIYVRYGEKAKDSPTSTELQDAGEDT